MARKKGRPKGSENHNPEFIAQKTRSAFYRGLQEACRRENKYLHELFADWLQKDPKGTFNMVGPFFPKEQKQEIGGSLADFLLQISREQRRSSLPEANEKAIDGEYEVQQNNNNNNT